MSGVHGVDNMASMASMTSKPTELPDGRIVWVDDGVEPVVVTIHLSDGTVRHKLLALEAGVDVERVTVGNRHFTEDGVSLIEHYCDMRCASVDVDGIRYVRADS